MQRIPKEKIFICNLFGFFIIKKLKVLNVIIDLIFFNTR